MKTLVKLALLVTVFVTVFLSPARIGAVLYYGMFPLMFLFAYFFYLISYWVSEADVRKVRKEPFAVSLFCGKLPQMGSGDLERGRLVITEKCLEFYRREEKVRTKEKPCYPAWTLAVSDIRSLGVGPVLSVRKGVIFYLDDGDVRFVYAGAKRKKDILVHALGWTTVPRAPEPVEVFAEAAEAPSFSEVVGNADDRKGKERS